MGQELLRLQNGSDVRGVAIAAEQEDITLSKENAYAIARSFGRWVKKQSPNKKEKYVATVGMDSRLSGPMLKGAVMYGLAAEGFHVYDAALSSTPAIFMSTVFEEIQADCGVMITASHLPA
ncbi:MAG: phosphomannomutase/phosphoglucomutase, partial [Eubacteriaceae bacterium]|nr:phosphomannomutase/phosphoglucomutase [Eubacteriaceae bacterium]